MRSELAFVFALTRAELPQTRAHLQCTEQVRNEKINDNEDRRERI